MSMRKYTREQLEMVQKFATMSELEYYEQYIADAPLEEQEKWIEEFAEIAVEDSSENKTDLENDAVYQEIMKKVK